ncbi:MAG: YafY family protein [Cyclobacteriaceae bacterium]
MNRIDRLNALVVHLQSKPRVTLDELEERFELSRRTLFRDVRSLIEAGIPIDGDAGEGYFIVEGYHLPPVVFNKEEAAAILMAGKFILQNADQATANAFDQALIKVKAVLRYADKDFLEQLDQKVTVRSSPSIAKEGFPDSNLNTVQTALATQRVLKIAYHSNYKDEATEREVLPLGLVYYSSRWHLVGYCRLRQDMRDFRTDRMNKVEIVNETFDPAEHPDYRDFATGMMDGSDAKEATVRFLKDIARFVGDQKYLHGFLEERSFGDYVEMKFATPSYQFLARWLLSYGDFVTVESPSELQGMVATFSKELFEHHKKYFES